MPRQLAGLAASTVVGPDLGGQIDTGWPTDNTWDAASSLATTAPKPRGAVAGGGVPGTSAARPFQCRCCPQCFATDSDLKRHVRTHTGEKPFRCALCSMAFSRKDHLRDHELCHTDQQPYACHLCPKKYTRRRLLRRHVLAHHHS